LLDVPDDLRAQPRRARPAHQARRVAARDVDRRRRDHPGGDGPGLRPIVDPDRARGAGRLLWLRPLLRPARLSRHARSPGMTRRSALALDLADDPQLIAEYDRHHAAVWPEIERSLRSAGIAKLEIYRTGNRLFMVLEVSPSFSFEAKAVADAADPKVQEWERLM